MISDGPWHRGPVPRDCLVGIACRWHGGFPYP
jgi:hypothetical protein